MSAAKRKTKSPTWRNPRDMIKRHLKRKSSRCLVPEGLASSSSAPNIDLDTASEPPLKFSNSANRSSNPFKHSSPIKKIRTGNEKENDGTFNWESESALSEFPTGIFDVIKETEKDLKGNQRSKLMGTPDQVLPVDFSCFTSNFSRDSHLARTDSCERRVSKTLPIDLRLGTKIRIESLKPFPWMRDDDQPGNYQVRITGLESDVGIQLFLRSFGWCKQDEYNPLIVEPSSMARLEASTLYWQFPNIPWMSTFPRLDAARRFVGIKKEKAPSLSSLGRVFVDSLDSQWVAAFSHLFFSWKKGERRHFYFCCSAFTVLFIKTIRDNGFEMQDNSCSRSSWTNNYVLSVIITPTTSGFRQQLREEGINFELPLRQNSRRSSHEHGGIYFGLENENSILNDVTQSSLMSVTSQGQLPMVGTLSSDSLKSHKDDNGEVTSESDGEQDVSGDSDHATWLQEIGVSPKLKRTLTRNLSLSSVNEKSLMDSAMTEMTQQAAVHLSSPSDISRTVVLITEPTSIQTLFNFLNESKACHPSTGPSAGLPPTLLSSEPFLHSTLKNLTKFSQIVKSDKNETKYICELSNGPIMPHMLSQLKVFFATCLSLNAPENRLKVRIYGRNFCAALNQVCHLEGASDYVSYEYAVNENLYYII